MLNSFGYGSRQYCSAGNTGNCIYFQQIWPCYGRRPLSDGVQTGLTGADADGFLYVGDEDLSVADPPGLGGTADRVDCSVDQIVADHDLDFDLGQEVHDIFGAAVQFGMALLPSEALGFRHCDALESHFLKRFLHLVELERLNDGFDLLHLSASRAFPDEN